MPIKIIRKTIDIEIGVSGSISCEYLCTAKDKSWGAIEFGKKYNLNIIRG